jgi:tetratricopeptide (TPR) repeat protein
VIDIRLIIGKLQRSLRLRLARRLGRFNYRLKSKLGSLLLLLIATILVVWLVEHVQQFSQQVQQFNEQAIPVVNAWVRHPTPPPLSSFTLLYALRTLLSLLVQFLLNIFGWIVNQLYLFLAWLKSQASIILGLYALVLLLGWVWKARKRVVIEEFVDYASKQPDTAVKGLATLLVVKLSHLRDLYRAVDEQRAISTSVSTNQSIDATIKVEDVSEFLKDAVSAQSKFSLGALEIPVGTLLSLFGRIVQGPRILGSLHKENDLITLTAQMVGGKQLHGWRVDRQESAAQTALQKEERLNSMVEELAFQMFTDLALSGSVRWKATATFCEGLQAYRDCLRAPKDRELNLEKAERKFIETLAEDQKFDLAYYNLGVVYTELGQNKAAEIAFTNAINQNAGEWNTYYALALSRFRSATEAKGRGGRIEEDVIKYIDDIKEIEQKLNSEVAKARMNNDEKIKIQAKLNEYKDIKRRKEEVNYEYAFSMRRYESVVELCKRVKYLKPGSANVAKAYQLTGQSQDQIIKLDKTQRVSEDRLNELDKRIKEIEQCLEPTTKVLHKESQSHIEIHNHHSPLPQRGADRSRKMAIRHSWWALCKAEIKGQGMPNTENSMLPQLETIASVSLANRAVSYKERGKYRQAAMLLKQSLSLTRTNADFYASYRFELGETYFLWGTHEQVKHFRQSKYNQAVQEYKHAIRIKPEKMKYLASLALVYAKLGKEENALNACENVLDTAYDATKEDYYAAKEDFKDALQNVVYVYDVLYLDKSSNPVQQINIAKKMLEEERELKEKEEEMKKGELTVDEFVKELKEILDKCWKKEDLEWKSAHIFLAMSRHVNESGGVKKLEKDEIISKLENKLEKLEECNISSKWEYGQLARVLGSLYLDLAKEEKTEEAVNAEKAETYFRVAIEHLEKKYPNTVRKLELHKLLADSLLGQKKTQEALRETELAISHDSLSHSMRKDLGQIYFYLNEFELAIDAWKSALLWRNALMSEPKDPTIYYSIGITYANFLFHYRDFAERSAKIREAIEYFKRAFSLFESHQQKYRDRSSFYLGYLHLVLAEYEEAISYFKISQSHSELRLTSIFHLGVAHLKNKEYDESKQLFEALLEETEKLKNIKNINDIIEEVGLMTLGEFMAVANWGQAFIYAERDTKLALNEAQQLIKKAQGYIENIEKVDQKLVIYPELYPDCEGWILYKLGRTTEAIECLEQAVYLKSDAEIYFHLALAYEQHLRQCKDDAQLIRQVQICCQHVQELDIKKEYEQRVNDILLNLQKSVPKESDQW